MLEFSRIESAGVRPAAAMWSWVFLALLLLASVSVDGGRAAAALADNEAVGESRLDESWPQWRGPMRDGKSATTGIRRRWPEGGPELVWTSEGAGSGYASVTIADGMLFSTGNQNGRQVVSAFSLDDGGTVMGDACY